MRHLFPDQLITIRSEFGQRTFVVGSKLIGSALLAGGVLLAWTVFTVGMVLWDLTGLENQNGALGESGVIKVDSLGIEIDKLSNTAKSLRNQVDAALDFYQAEVSFKSTDNIAGSGRELKDQDGAAGGSAASQVRFLLSALDRSIAELEQERRLSSEKTKVLEALETETKLRDEKMKRLVARLIDSMSQASEGLENIFANLGLSPDGLAKEAQNLYSGIGGPTIVEYNLAETGRPYDLLQGIRLDTLAEEINRFNLNRLAFLGVPIGHPVKGSNRLTSGFGQRRHPVTGRYHHHGGTDFAAPRGTDVFSTGDGVVTFAGTESGYGKTIRIRHMNGIVTLYGHLDRIRVNVGQRVARGLHIGDIGSTGQSTGPHLHYEVRVGSRAVNPMTFIRAENHVHKQKRQ